MTGNMCEAADKCCVPCAQYLCRKPSLSGLDRQIFGVFFLWGFISVLIGGIVGGSVLSALNPNIISEPSAPTQITHALPAKSCNIAMCCTLCWLWSYRQTASISHGMLE